MASLGWAPGVLQGEELGIDLQIQVDPPFFERVEEGDEDVGFAGGRGDVGVQILGGDGVGGGEIPEVHHRVGEDPDEKDGGDSA